MRARVSALQALVAKLERDRSLDDPARLPERIDALDRLEVWVPDGQPPTGLSGSPLEADLYRRTLATRARLEAINRECYEAIRREIQQGTGGDSLLAWARQSADEGGTSLTGDDGYDWLDTLVGEVLQFDLSDTDLGELAADMVPYQPTPARHIFDLLGRLALTELDVLVDIGSGLGQVPLLTSICSCGSSIGIELQAAYVECARRSAAGLSLSDVTFVQQDARAADLSAGTVFYLYTPFSGAIMRSVLDSLRVEARGRAIRVCTYGACTLTVAEEPWLRSVATPKESPVTIFRSVC